MPITQSMTIMNPLIALIRICSAMLSRCLRSIVMDVMNHCPYYIRFILDFDKEIFLCSAIEELRLFLLALACMQRH